MLQLLYSIINYINCYTRLLLLIQILPLRPIKFIFKIYNIKDKFININSTIDTGLLVTCEPSAVVATGHVCLNDGFKNKLNRNQSIQIKKAETRAS